jgi:hypothetical protein
MKEVSSSTISHVGHENGDTLVVRFKSNPKVEYCYACSPNEHAAMMGADSIGSHHHKFFKGKPFVKREVKS